MLESPKWYRKSEQNQGKGHSDLEWRRMDGGTRWEGRDQLIMTGITSCDKGSIE